METGPCERVGQLAAIQREHVLGVPGPVEVQQRRIGEGVVETRCERQQRHAGRRELPRRDAPAFGAHRGVPCTVRVPPGIRVTFPPSASLASATARSRTRRTSRRYAARPLRSIAHAPGAAGCEAEGRRSDALTAATRTATRRVQVSRRAIAKCEAAGEAERRRHQQSLALGARALLDMAQLVLEGAHA